MPKAQASMEYILSLVAAFFIAMVVLFILFNFAGYVRGIVLGVSPPADEQGITLPIKDEFRLGFIFGMVVLYLVEHAIIFFFYYFLTGKRETTKGEKKLATAVFKGEGKERRKETTF
jgi:hypothetical protein